MSAGLRAGYKQTEVGVIPVDWDAKRLKDISPRQSVGLVINPSTYFDKSGTVPMLVGSNVGENEIDWESAKRITTASNQSLPASRLYSDDLVMVRVGEPGITAVIPPEYDGCNCASMMIVRKHSSFDSQWLCFAMNSPLGRSRVAGVQYGTAQKQFNISDAVDFIYPVPPLTEQRAIAEALSDVDALLGGLDRLIAKKQGLKVAAMQQLLTGQTRLPGFSGEWEVKPFSAVLVRVNAKVHQIQTSDYQDTGKYPVVDQGKQQIIGFSDREDRCLQCPEGGVIVFGDHTCFVKFIDFDFLVGADGTQILHGKAGQHTRFHCLQLQYRGVESTGYNRHFKFLKDREFLVPPLPEQTAIATVLSDMDTELAALQARRTKTQALKQAMMQELLTGRIRLVEPQGASV